MGGAREGPVGGWGCQLPPDRVKERARVMGQTERDRDGEREMERRQRQGWGREICSPDDTVNRRGDGGSKGRPEVGVLSHRKSSRCSGKSELGPGEEMQELGISVACIPEGQAFPTPTTPRAQRLEILCSWQSNAGRPRSI